MGCRGPHIAKGVGIYISTRRTASIPSSTKDRISSINASGSATLVYGIASACANCQKIAQCTGYPIQKFAQLMYEHRSR